MSIDNYYLLDDMEKYDPNFNRELFDSMKSEEVKPIFREYYSKKLPIDLLTWSRVNEPPDKMIYKDGYWRQILFIRNTIAQLLNETYEEYKDNPVFVISTHM